MTGVLFIRCARKLVRLSLAEMEFGRPRATCVTRTSALQVSCTRTRSSLSQLVLVAFWPEACRAYQTVSCTRCLSSCLTGRIDTSQSPSCASATHENLESKKSFVSQRSSMFTDVWCPAPTRIQLSNSFFRGTFDEPRTPELSNCCSLKTKGCPIMKQGSGWLIASVLQRNCPCGPASVVTPIAGKTGLTGGGLRTAATHHRATFG
jgi:hypothetical protein